MKALTQEEMQETLAMLTLSGMRPMVCDTAVPYYEANVPAGVPADLGDVVRGDYIMLPRELVGMNPTVVVNVRGDSMKDAGIEEGDRLELRLTDCARDGDIVVACIDGESTVKSYFVDEDGCQWLVPSNDAYDAICLTEDMQVRILGVVVNHIKKCPRTSWNNCMKSISRTKGKLGCRTPSKEKMKKTILRMAGKIKHGRQWFAVYRSMVDMGGLTEGAFSEFCEAVARIVPEHGHLPNAVELRRLSVQSFRKSASLWECSDAPVSGSRFDEYLRLAQLTAAELVK